MKKITSLITFFSLFFIIGFNSGCGFIDKQNNPKDTVRYYYRLLDKKDYKTAHSLLTEKSKKIITAKLLQQNMEQFAIKSIKIGKIYRPVINGNLAAVSVITENEFMGMNAPLLNVNILKKENGKWCLMQDISELKNKKDYLKLADLMIKAEQYVAEDKSGLSKYNVSEQDSIKKQLANAQKESKLLKDALSKGSKNKKTNGKDSAVSDKNDQSNGSGSSDNAGEIMDFVHGD